MGAKAGRIQGRIGPRNRAAYDCEYSKRPLLTLSMLTDNIILVVGYGCYTQTQWQVSPPQEGRRT